MELTRLLRMYDDSIWNERIKLVRHADARCDLDALQRSGHLLEYEARQSRPRFHDADILFTFLAEQGSRCRFVAGYRVVGVQENVPLPLEFPYPDLGPGVYRYAERSVRGTQKSVKLRGPVGSRATSAEGRRTGGRQRSAATSAVFGS